MVFFEKRYCLTFCWSSRVAKTVTKIVHGRKLVAFADAFNQNFFFKIDLKTMLLKAVSIKKFTDSLSLS